MPPKRKDFLKPNHKAMSKLQEPQSENDFLETADEFEQAAGKWRAGDAAKATRFFNRAIDTYSAGLQRYPNSFDLAYNKANLEYNMSEDNRIVTMLGNRSELLEETLKSHRAAIALNPDNTDVNFNTAQVLTSLAEDILEGRSKSKFEARLLLEEAVATFAKCLANQQHEFEEMQIEIEKAKAQSDAYDASGVQASIPESSNEEAMETSSTTSSAPGEWATVIEPATPETILETCTAHLGALTTLLGLYDPSDSVAIQTVVGAGLDTVNSKIPSNIKALDASSALESIQEPAPGSTLSIGSASIPEEHHISPKDEALLAAATFQATVAEIMYRGSHIDSGTYARQIEGIFAPLQTALENNTLNPSALNARSAYADALIDLASAIADGPQHDPSSPSFATDLEIQWTGLTQAQTLLTQLSAQTSPLSPSRLADVFLARGDTDLFRFRISLFAGAKPAWLKSKMVLVSNAGVFYRGARSYAERASAMDVQKTADAKAIVAEILKEAAAGSGVDKEHWKGRRQDVARVLEQMVEEGIIGRENTEGVVGFTD